jgi:putative ABC transport system permease protein
MFDQDKWQEIFSALLKNKLRTFLTAFGVFWGIFMLVIMLGSSNGLKNGMFRIMGDFATNSLFIWPERTNLPCQGFLKGRNWHFTSDDTKALCDNINEIEVIAPCVRPPGGSGLFIRGKNTGSFSIRGDYPAIFKIDPVTLLQGRLLNYLDLIESRKVVVIGQRVREMLFLPKEDPLGQYIQIQGVYFQVVGVYKSKHTQDWGRYQNESVYIPFTTVQKAFNMGNIVRYFAITAKKNYSVEQLELRVRKFLAFRHKISPEDKQAFGTENVEQEFNSMNSLFVGINFFTWVVGALTLIAGVIGISNIMLIVVKERTREIGIQRAIGAPPSKIVGQIVLESVSLTFIAGLIGLVSGVLIIEGVNLAMANVNPDTTPFLNPEINLKVAVSALVLLVITGSLAGMVPAFRAVKIKPIDALRAEI